MVKKVAANKPPRVRKNTPEPNSPSMTKKASPKTMAPAVSSKKFWTTDFITERGFKSGKHSPAFTSTVIDHGWEKFVQHRNPFIPQIVGEFYAGIPDASEGHAPTYSLVRDVRFPFDAIAINSWYELGYHRTGFEKKRNSWGRTEMEALKKRIALDNAPWEKVGNEFKIKKSWLIEEASMWFNFIKHSLLPTGHTTTVEKERLILIDSIIKGENIDVGRLISREILACKGKPGGNLFLPCLITELCIKAEVEIDRKEERRAPAGPFPTEFKARQKPTAIAPEGGPVLQHLKLQQQAVWRFMKEHYEWEQARFQELCKGKSTVEAPSFPDWVLDEVEQEIEAENEKQPTKIKSPTKRKATGKTTPSKKKKKQVQEEPSWSSEEEGEIEEEKELEKNEQRD